MTALDEQPKSTVPSDPAPDPTPEPEDSSRKHVSELWAEHAVRSPSFPQVVITLSFLITFGLARFVTHAIRNHWLGLKNVTSGGTHIHHYVWGIAILIVVGFVELAFHPARLRSVLGALHGAAVALVLDEFALLLNLKDVYWTAQGRQSIDAVIIVAGLLFLALLLRPFLRATVKEYRRR